MTQRIATPPGSARPTTRALALLALVLVISLGCWRASNLVTQPEDAWVPGSQVEASLFGILEPVAGKGNLRLSVTEHNGAARTVLILLSSDAGDTAPTIERLANSVAMIEPAAGDQLIVEHAEFANGLPGRLSVEGWVELGLFGAICALLVWIGSGASEVGSAKAPVSAEHKPAMPVRLDQIENAPSPKPRPVRQIDPDMVADLARKNPARSASILRDWMRGEGDVA